MELNEEINKFLKENESKQNNSTNLIYLRLSAINNALPKEEQVQDTINKLKADFNSLLTKYNNLKEDGYLLFVEVKSAYKNSIREVFINLYENYLFKDTSIKDILENENTPNPKNLYIASYDRVSRVFFYSLTFQIIRKLRNINIYTLSDEELNFELRNKDVVTKENLDQTMFVFHLMMISSISAKHSEDMSIKIKKRITKVKGQTISSKSGKKWGVAKTISDSMREKIKERYKKFTAEEIQTQSDIYQIKAGVKQKIALNTILAILREKL